MAEVNFNCRFSEEEIEVVVQACIAYAVSGACPEGLKPSLVSVTKAFIDVQRNGAAL